MRFIEDEGWRMEHRAVFVWEAEAEGSILGGGGSFLTLILFSRCYHLEYAYSGI